MLALRSLLRIDRNPSFMGRPHPIDATADDEPTSDVYEAVRTTGPTMRGLRLAAPMIGGRYEVREMLGGIEYWKREDRPVSAG